MYPPGIGGPVGEAYSALLTEGRVDSKLLNKVLEGCATRSQKVDFLAALLVQPPTEQQRESIEAFGEAWTQTGNLLGQGLD